MEHKPHSELVSVLEECLDNLDYTNQSVMELKKRGLVALAGLEEQLETAQEQLSAPRHVTALRVGIDWHSHDGMVTVYDRDGRYMGCMGVERFHRLLADDAISRGPNPASRSD